VYVCVICESNDNNICENNMCVIILMWNDNDNINDNESNDNINNINIINSNNNINND